MTDTNRVLAARGAERLRKGGHHDEAAAIEGFLAPGGWVMLKSSDTRETSQMSLVISETLKAELRAASAEFAMPLPALAEEGYRAVLESGWLPPQTLLVRSGSKKTTLTLRVDNGLRKQVQPLLPGLSERAGYRVTESSITMAWMCDQLGVNLGAGSTQVLVLPEAMRDHFVRAQAEGVVLDEVVDERLQALLDGSWELPRPARAAKGSMQGVNLVKMGVRVRVDLLDELTAQIPQLSEKVGVTLYPGMVVRWILIDRLGQPAE